MNQNLKIALYTFVAYVLILGIFTLMVPTEMRGPASFTNDLIIDHNPLGDPAA